MRRSTFPFPKRCFCPTNSSKDFGLSFAANGCGNCTENKDSSLMRHSLFHQNVDSIDVFVKKRLFPADVPYACPTIIIASPKEKKR